MTMHAMRETLKMAVDAISQLTASLPSLISVVIYMHSWYASIREEGAPWNLTCDTKKIGTIFAVIISDKTLCASEKRNGLKHAVYFRMKYEANWNVKFWMWYFDWRNISFSSQL